MVEATANPMNLYCNGSIDGGYDSSSVSGESSRRSSLGFKEYVRSRRYTMLSKPNRMCAAKPGSSSTESGRNSASTDSQFTNDTTQDDVEEDLSPKMRYQRRMSVPEKVFLNADFAILRPSNEGDLKFEIVAAFDRNTDPYRHYMQNLTCYDLQPNHGAIVVIDGSLKIHKALTALNQCGHQAAIVSMPEAKGGFDILTVTDCLKAIVMASEGVHKVAEQTVCEFMKLTNRKHLISADVNASVWDAARLICMNRVHRVPVVQYDDSLLDGRKGQGDVLYILSLRSVLMETVLKLSDPKRSIAPHMKETTLLERKVGTWSNIITAKTTITTGAAIRMLLDRRISSLPLIDEHNRVVAVMSKNDVNTELVNHPSNYLEVLDIPAVDIACRPPRLILGTTTMTIYDSIHTLVNTDKQSLVIIDVEGRPIGIVSYSDIMDYIQNYADTHHKFSLA